MSRFGEALLGKPVYDGPALFAEMLLEELQAAVRETEARGDLLVAENERLAEDPNSLIDEIHDSTMAVAMNTGEIMGLGRAVKAINALLE